MKEQEQEIEIRELTERNYFDEAARRVIHRRITNVAGRLIAEGYVGLCTVVAQMSDGRSVQREDQFTIDAQSVGEAFEYFDRDLEKYKKIKTAELTKPHLVDAAGLPIRQERSVIGGDGRTSRHNKDNGKSEGE